MAHSVFISYSANDKTVAEAMCATLESEGIRCWIAPRDIVPGMEWGENVIEAIERARVVVLVFSAAANASPLIRREVGRAVNRGVLVLPLRIEDVQPTRELEYFIGTSSWFDALTPPLEVHFRRLAREIKMRLERAEIFPGAMPAGAAMPCAPAPAPPTMPMGAPSPAPPPSAGPAGRSGGGLFRGLAGLFRRSASAPASPRRGYRNFQSISRRFLSAAKSASAGFSICICFALRIACRTTARHQSSRRIFRDFPGAGRLFGLRTLARPARIFVPA